MFNLTYLVGYSQTKFELCAIPYENAIHEYLANKDSLALKNKLDSSQIVWKNCICSQRIPEIQLNTIKNSIIKIDTNTVYVFQFWASWCPPCMAEIPIINQLYDEYNSKNVKFLTFAYNKIVEKENVLKFKNDLIQNTSILSKELGVLAFPTIFIISKKLEIKKVFMGASVEENFKLYSSLKEYIEIEINRQ